MSDPDTLATIVPMHHRPATREAQAYCGAAHGQQWPVTEATPPAWVELPTGATTALYRLVRNPRTARPAWSISIALPAPTWWRRDHT